MYILHKTKKQMRTEKYLWEGGELKHAWGWGAIMHIKNSSLAKNLMGRGGAKTSAPPPLSKKSQSLCILLITNPIVKFGSIN